MGARPLRRPGRSIELWATRTRDGRISGVVAHVWSEKPEFDRAFRQWDHANLVAEVCATRARDLGLDQIPTDSPTRVRVTVEIVGE